MNKIYIFLFLFLSFSLNLNASSTSTAACLYEIPTSKAINYYLFNQDSGNLIDVVGGLTMTNNNTVSFVDDIMGKCGDFVFANSEYFAKNIAGYRDTDNEGGISFWVKFDVNSASTSTWSYYGRVWSSFDDSTDTDRMEVYLSSHPNDLCFTLTIRDAFGTNIIKWSHYTVFSDGHPHHIAITSNGSRYLCYIDGKSVSFTVPTGTNDGRWLDDVAGRDNVLIGARHRSAGIDRFFDGKLDGVCYMYPEPSASEIFMQAQTMPKSMQ